MLHCYRRKQPFSPSPAAPAVPGHSGPFEYRNTSVSPGGRPAVQVLSIHDSVDNTHTMARHMCHNQSPAVANPHETPLYILHMNESAVLPFSHHSHSHHAMHSPLSNS